MCLDQPDTRIVEQIIYKGIDYIDVNASSDFLKALGNLDNLARASGSTVFMSVSLEPKLINILVWHASETVSALRHLDIFVMLGLGDAHVEAAILRTLDNINAEIILQENRLPSFEESRQTRFPKYGKRMAYRFDFPDQYIIPQTLGLTSVSSWLCFDSRLLTRMFAGLKKAGILQLLEQPKIKNIFVRIFKRFNFGSDDYILQVVATSGNNGHQDAVRFTIHGQNEARMTGKIAVAVANFLYTSSISPGVFHIQKLFEPVLFFKRALEDGVEFTYG